MKKNKKELLFHIDSPKEFNEKENLINTNDNILAITGWILIKEEPAKVKVKNITTGEKYESRIKIERDDVAKAFPKIPEAKNSGFFVSIPLRNKNEKISLYCEIDNEEIVLGEIKTNFIPKNYLPEFKNIKKGIRKGRNIYEGYQRGWGLQHGDLIKEIENDNLYREAIELSRSRTIVREEHLMNIFLIMKFGLPKISQGDIIEFGSYTGGSAIFMAQLTKRLHPNIKVYALDTFTGMPETDKSIDAHNQADFNNVNLQELRNYAKEIGLDNLEFHQGMFEDTAISILKKAKNISLSHIDCDIYSAVAFSYEAVKNYMVPGGYVVFDDACISSCIGATEAVEEYLIKKDQLHSEQIYPHFVFRMGL